MIGVSIPQTVESRKKEMLLQNQIAERMSALCHLKALLSDPAGHETAARAFLAGQPSQGRQVLAGRIAAIAACTSAHFQLRPGLALDTGEFVSASELSNTSKAP